MKEERGHLHPLTILGREVADIFSDMGFGLPVGPELETEYYNFDSLNIPGDHPARDMWDTFWLKPQNGSPDLSKTDLGIKPREAGKLLRTHTSPVQVRYMEKNKPPFAVCSIGKTYRYEATDMTHESNFNQVEGLMVGENISLANLKGVLEEFFRRLFKKDISVRFRPSFFPFVEPGLEVDMVCFSCEGKGMKVQGANSIEPCNVCKKTGWIEIMGAGMVHPKVLSGCQIDPNVYQGFAFGMGLERLAMLLYGIDDVRLFHSGDLRLTRQF